MVPTPLIIPASDTSVEVRFGEEISPETNRKVFQFERLILEKTITGIVETVPVYGSLYIHYDPSFLAWGAIRNYIQSMLEVKTSEIHESFRTIDIVVSYGGEMGPDLTSVAQIHAMSEAEVVRIHSGKMYQVYMMGFTPGFAYLGEVDQSIATPRLKQPRLLVPPGSVGIAGSQTGIYPIESPGGWQIIGRTAEPLFNPEQEKPFRLQPGDRVRFIPSEDSLK